MSGEIHHDGEEAEVEVNGVLVPGMYRTLFGREPECERVALVFIPNDPFPDVVKYNDRLFHYDDPAGEFCEATVLTVL